MTAVFDPTAGICGRTAAVRDAIVALISGVTHCALVTDAHLAAITGLLYLRSDGFTALAAGDFDELTALTELDLHRNGFTELPAGVFDELTSLTRLDLLRNSLSTLPAGVFDELTALTYLRLHSNSLSTLPAGVFDELTALTALDLQNNSLSTLPDDVFEELTSLTDLQLFGNPGAPFSPTADALPDDGTVPVAGGDVTLDGSGSDGGPWGTNVTYSWAASGATVTFDDAASATPVVTIPPLTVGTELTFTLTVTGRGGIGSGIQHRHRHRHGDGGVRPHRRHLRAHEAGARRDRCPNLRRHPLRRCHRRPSRRHHRRAVSGRQGHHRPRGGGFRRADRADGSWICAATTCPRFPPGCSTS